MEWISTKDKLPDTRKDGEYFLVCVSGKPCENVTLISVIMTAGYTEKYGWGIDEYLGWENPPVTHWMPLPGLPDSL